MSYMALASLALGALIEVVRCDAGEQVPKVFSALDELRGGFSKPLSAGHIQRLYSESLPTDDDLAASESPEKDDICKGFNQPGFYADISAEGKCRVFHRCDVNGKTTKYVCPGLMRFNQITLVCDWWYNVDCSKTEKFFGYSNSRLYTNAVLLDDENDYTGTGAVDGVPSGGEISRAPLPKRQKLDPGLIAERMARVVAENSSSSETIETTSPPDPKRESTSIEANRTTNLDSSVKDTNTTASHAAMLKDLVKSSLAVLQRVYPQLQSGDPTKDWTAGAVNFTESDWIGFCQEGLGQAGSDTVSPDLPREVELERLSVAGLAVSFCRKFYELTKLPDVPHPMDSIIKKLSGEWEQAGQIQLPQPN